MNSFSEPPEGERGTTSSHSFSWSPRFETLLETSGTLVLELDIDGNVIHASAAAVSLLGEHTAGPGASFFTRLSLPDAQSLAQLEPESTHRIQFQLECPDGVMRWLEFFCKKKSNPDAADRLLLMGRDVTAVRDAETEVRQLHEEINRLRPRQELGRLAGRIAHDFNNILGAILAYTDLARREIRPEHPCQSYLAQVMTAGDRAKNLVRQVLTFSRRQLQRRERIPLFHLVQEVLQLLKPTMPPAVKVRADMVAQSDIVVVDSIQIHEVITNLVTNAIHAMEFTGGDLVVRLSDRSESELMLSFQDTGHGIDEDTQQRLFEPFFTTRASRGGTGLGLTVVKAIMADHGGSVFVQSARNHGATFFLTFPKATS